MNGQHRHIPVRLRSKPPVAFCRAVRQILRIELQAKLGAYMSVSERGEKMDTLAIIGIIFVAACVVLLVLSIVRINHPRTPEEDRASFAQDCKDFDAYMAKKGLKK
jgi:hypothetical protein